MTEHLSSTNVVAVVHSIFNICLRFGIGPNQFRNRLLISLLKKPQHSDTIVPNNYWPQTNLSQSIKIDGNTTSLVILSFDSSKGAVRYTDDTNIGK